MQESSNSFGADLSLVPGVRRLRPDDHFMIVSETDASPMHIGALLFLGVPARKKKGLTLAIRRHIKARLAATPLLCRLAQAPEGYDSDVWVDIADCDMDYHVVRAEREGEGDDTTVRAFIAARSMERLDLSRPPFRIFVLEDLQDGKSAIYIKIHHSVVDGIGFQTILGLLSDDHLGSDLPASDAILPDEQTWRHLADKRFERLTALSEVHRENRRKAKAALEALVAQEGNQRPETPTLKLSGPTSPTRNYAYVSLPLERVRALKVRLGGTVNDIFLALASMALRRYLIEIDDLPASPIVVNSARSYRQAEHGKFGNRIVAMHPHLATHIADPIERLRAIQREMAREKRRADFDQAMLDAPEQPFGASKRREHMSRRLSENSRLLPGNITLSNVPGRAEVLSYAGFPVLANYPVPILGSGRFLNITSRRNADRLDLGVMSDAEKIPEASAIADGLILALREYERVAP